MAKMARGRLISLVNPLYVYNIELITGLVNENPVPNAIGVASTKKGAQNALVEQLHVQQHPVLVRVF